LRNGVPYCFKYFAKLKDPEELIYHSIILISKQHWATATMGVRQPKVWFFMMLENLLKHCCTKRIH
jgi:hypothetical protein